MSGAAVSEAPGSKRFLPAERKTAALVLSAVFMLHADTSILNTAIPSVQRGIGASVSQVQLAVAGYTVAYAVMLITGGRLGDLFGRRRIFIIGAASFTLASLASGLAQSPDALIASRVWQGLSASVVYPQVIATLNIVISAERRGRAFAFLGAVVSCATIAGPIIAGLLITLNIAGTQWRPIFLINIPVGIVVVALAPRMVPANKGLRVRLDYAGSLIVILLLAALLVPLTVGRDHGWPLWGWVLLICTPVLLGTFLWLEAAIERRGRTPLLRPGLWADPVFLLGVALYIVYFSAIMPFFLYYSITVQFGLGYSTLATAVAMAPYAVGSTFTSLLSARIVARLSGPRTLLTGCGICVVGNVLMMATIEGDHSGRYFGLAMVPSMVITGMGFGLVLGPLLGFVLARVQMEDSGAVSGLLSTAQQIGYSLGVAVIGLAFFRGYRGELEGLRYPALRTDITLGVAVGTTGFLLASVLVWLIMRRSRPADANSRADARASAASGR